MITRNVLDRPFSEKHRRTTEVMQHYPGASVASYLPADLDTSRWMVMHNMRRCENLSERVYDGDAITLCPLPGDGGLTFLGLKGVEAFLALFAVNTAIGIGLSYLLMPARPKVEGDDESPVYNLIGVRNNRGEGLPIPFYVGRMRAGGQVIVEFTEVIGLPPTTLYKFILDFGFGPAESIGQYTTDTPDDTPLSSDDPDNPLPDGMLIEGNAAENFRNVKLWLRMGDPDQDPIPGFEKVATEHSVGQSLLQEETTDWNPTAAVSGVEPYNPSPADDPVWDEYGVAYDMTGDADEVAFLLYWPTGLYRLHSSGDMLPATVKVMRRIIELDGTGTPITTGGPDGDGYLRFPLSDVFESQITQPFAQEVTQILYDPQTSTPGTPGDSLECDGTGGYAQADHTVLTIPNKPANGDAFDEFTMEGWYRTGSDPTADDEAILAELWDNTITRRYGISLRLAYQTYIGFEQHLVPVVRIGKTSGVEDFYEGHDDLFAKPTVSLGASPNTWLHFAVTYKPGFGTLGLQQRIRLYVNGKIILETITSSVAMWPYDTHIDLNVCSGYSTGGAIGGAVTTASGRWDELKFYTEELSVADVALAHFGGNGVYGSSKSTLFAGYHFDSDLTDFSGNANTLTAAAGVGAAPTILADGGKVMVGGTLVRKRGRFRVEIMRINPDSTHARTQDDVELPVVKTILDEAFSYPGKVLVGGEIEVDDQMRGTSPSISLIGKFRKHLVWDGINASNPTYRREWSPFPPDQAIDALLDTRQGAGSEIRPEDIDVESFQLVRDRCAEVVYDKRGQRELSSDGDWTDATYSDTTADPVTGIVRGSIAIEFADYTVPDHWVVGGYLRFTGWPSPASDDPDVNSGDDGPGYEIYSIEDGDSGKIVRVYWDRLDEGDAWTAGSLNTQLAPDTVADYDCYIEGGEHRFEGHGAFDTSVGFWDALIKLLVVCRAMPVKEGRKIRLRDDRARSPVDVVGQASVLPGSFEVDFEWGRTRPNHYDAQFIDADRAYEPAQASLTSPDVQVAASFNGLRRESLYLEFCTSRRQALAQLAYMINHGRYIDRQGRFSLSLEGLGIEPSHVVRLSSDLTGWGVSGMMLSGCTTTAIKVDRAITLTGGTVYYVSLRDGRTGTYERAQVTVPTAGATYAPGDTIDLDETLSFVPQEDDRFILYSDGQEIDAKLERVVMDDGLRHQVEWTRYHASVHEDDWFEDIDASEFTSVPETSAATMPGPVLNARLMEAIQDDSGSRITKLVVSWTHDEDTIRAVARTVIHGARDDGAAVPIGEVIGRGAIAKITVPGLAIGDRYTVWVQPVSHTGVRAAVDRCISASIEIMGYAPPPDAPTGLSYEVSGDMLTYTWTPVDRPDLAYSVRIGGWILGHEVGRVEGNVSSLGPTSFWTSGGDDDPTVYLRAMTRSGRASGHAEVELDVDFDHAQKRELEDQAWEDFGNGFVFDTPTIPNGEFDGLERVDGEWESPYAQFDSSTGATNLTGTYTTAPNGNINLKPRRYYIEVFVDAEQVHPATWEDMAVAWGDARVADWTWEGPADEREGTLRCSMCIEVRYKRDDAWGDWEEYRPGIVWCQHAQARVTFTRPNTDFDIRMHRMHTRITNTPPTDNQRTDAQLWGEVELGS